MPRSGRTWGRSGRSLRTRAAGWCRQCGPPWPNTTCGPWWSRRSGKLGPGSWPSAGTRSGAPNNAGREESGPFSGRTCASLRERHGRRTCLARSCWLTTTRKSVRRMTPARPYTRSVSAGWGGPPAGQDDGELLKLADYLRALGSGGGGVREFVQANPYHLWPGSPGVVGDAQPAEDSPGELMRRAAAAFGLRPMGQCGGPAVERHPLLGAAAGPVHAGPPALFRNGVRVHGWGPGTGRGLDGPAK